LVGLPVSYGQADMAFEAVVRASNGAELGRKSFTAQLPLTESAYVAHKFPRQLPLLYQQISPGFRRFVCDTLNAAPSAAFSLSVPQEPQAASAPDEGLAGRLKKLKELKDTGNITDEEYQAKRKKLVDSI